MIITIRMLTCPSTSPSPIPPLSKRRGFQFFSPIITLLLSLFNIPSEFIYILFGTLALVPFFEILHTTYKQYIDQLQWLIREYEKLLKPDVVNEVHYILNPYQTNGKMI